MLRQGVNMGTEYFGVDLLCDPVCILVSLVHNFGYAGGFNLVVVGNIVLPDVDFVVVL